VKRRLAACLLAFAVLGCGEDEPAATSSSDTSAADGAARVTMQNIAFRPKSLTVDVGEQVTWTNAEDIEHNVVATSGAEFESEIFGKDGSYAFTPTEPGRVTYTCTLHQGMDGELRVAP
jgi:plastocyanin